MALKKLKALRKNKVRDGMDVRKDKAKKPNKKLRVSRRFSLSRIPRTWMRNGLVVSLTFLAILGSLLTQPALGSAAEPLNETRVPPSPTTVQVTPPPKGTTASTNHPPPDDPGAKEKSLTLAGQPPQIQGWLLPFPGGIVLWAAAGIALSVLVILLVMYARRRLRPAPGPVEMSSVPFLKSNDGSLYFRLDKLNEDGLIIGRGREGVDLRIEDSTPFVDTVSSQHARIYYNAKFSNVIIEDLTSTNGIFINGRQAPHKNLLKDGWVVGLGSVTLTYHDGESDTGPLD